ncbi:MAG TPA: hypothetical protein VGU61_17575 [Noviherbaspirillum sp.]|uniref:hypothetical protein n=1 Tax=Noviherbaspirillum sp. TaxID=1926288 RepID=UPI002DDCB38B|nr:hypothetical protein [Noviherbaspirillum sp.]HEV2612079.1 hypothetical protein [Noviherbaspirillum sp.]
MPSNFIAGQYMDLAAIDDAMSDTRLLHHRDADTAKIVGCPRAVSSIAQHQSIVVTAVFHWFVRGAVAIDLEHRLTVADLLAD